MTTTREAQAAAILKTHRGAARVAKARKLSPAFDAECRKADRPVGFSQWVGFIHGLLRHYFGRQEKVPATRGLGKLLASFFVIGLAMAVTPYLLLALFVILFASPIHRSPYLPTRYRRP